MLEAMKIILPVRLQPWEEAFGLLLDLQEQDGVLVAKIGPIQVALSLELGEKLKGHIGSRIAVLRTDTDYRFRIIEASR